MCEERDGRIDLDELIGADRCQTRIVAISHVQYASGFRADLERIGRAARAHDALLVVDVIQSLGVVPIDVESQLIDVAAGACHKWLLTPEGVGFLYLSDRARERIQPTLVGWISVPNPDDFNNFEQGWNQGTLAWETGHRTGWPDSRPGSKSETIKRDRNFRHSGHLEMLTDHLCERLQGHQLSELSVRDGPAKNRKSFASGISGGRSPMDLYHPLEERNISHRSARRPAAHLPSSVQYLGRNRSACRRSSIGG